VEFKEKTCLSRKYFYLDIKVGGLSPAHIANVIFDPIHVGYGAFTHGTRLTVFFIQVDSKIDKPFATTGDMRSYVAFFGLMSKSQPAGYVRMAAAFNYNSCLLLCRNLFAGTHGRVYENQPKHLEAGPVCGADVVFCVDSYSACLRRRSRQF